MLSVAKVTTPLEQTFVLTQCGYMEYDTNAWVENGKCSITDMETGEELTDDQLNAEVDFDDVKQTLSEYLFSKAQWTLEYDDNEC